MNTAGFNPASILNPTFSFNQASYTGANKPASSISSFFAVVRQIRDDSWNGFGPGRYELPDVRFVDIQGGGNVQLSTLYVNGKPVGELHGYTDQQAAVIKSNLSNKSNHFLNLSVEGHYGNAGFYIDSLSVNPNSYLNNPGNVPGVPLPVSKETDCFSIEIPRADESVTMGDDFVEIDGIRLERKSYKNLSNPGISIIA
ncbi:MAG: hypothetical protein AB2L14_32935 [Candidatus Xenobiia bacterium LiM19]